MRTMVAKELSLGKKMKIFTAKELSPNTEVNLMETLFNKEAELSTETRRGDKKRK